MATLAGAATRAHVGPRQMVAVLHRLGTIEGVTTEQQLRVPIQEAAKRGVSWLNEVAHERRVLLTRFGRVDAVVDSAERLDETAAKVEVASREVVERFADLALGRSSRWSLADVCSKLGLDPERVRGRARELS